MKNHLKRICVGFSLLLVMICLCSSCALVPSLIVGLLDEEPSVPQQIDEETQPIYLGEWEAITPESDVELKVNVTKDQIVYSYRWDEDFETYTYSYTVTEDEQFIYLEALSVSETSVDSMMFILIGRDTMAVCSRLLTPEDYYTGTTPSGALFYGECGLFARKGTAVEGKPANVNLDMLKDEYGDTLKYKYYPNSSILVITFSDEDAFDFEGACYYVKSNGELIYIESVATAFLNQYQRDDIFTEHNFVITDHT